MVMKTDNKAYQTSNAAPTLPKGAPPIPSILPTAPTGRMRQPATKLPRRTGVKTPLEQAAQAKKNASAMEKGTPAPSQQPASSTPFVPVPAGGTGQGPLPTPAGPPAGGPDQMGFSGATPSSPTSTPFVPAPAGGAGPGSLPTPAGQPAGGLDQMGFSGEYGHTPTGPPSETDQFTGEGAFAGAPAAPPPPQAQDLEGMKFEQLDATPSENLVFDENGEVIGHKDDDGNPLYFDDVWTDESGAKWKGQPPEGYVKSPDGKSWYDPTNPEGQYYDTTNDPEHPEYDHAKTQAHKWEAGWQENTEKWDEAADSQIENMDYQAAVAAAQAKRAAAARAAQTGTQYTSQFARQMGDIDMDIWGKNQAAKAEFMYQHEAKKLDTRIEHLRQRLALAQGEEAADLQRELTAALTEAQAKDAFLEQFWNAPNELLANLGADAFEGDTWDEFQTAMNEAGESGDPFAVWSVMKGVRVVFDEESGEAKLHYSDDWGDIFDQFQPDELDQMFRTLTDAKKLEYGSGNELYDWDEESKSWNLSKSKFKKWMAQNGWDPGQGDKLWDYYQQKYKDIFNVPVADAWQDQPGYGVEGVPFDKWQYYDDEWMGQFGGAEAEEGEYIDWSYQGDDDE